MPTPTTNTTSSTMMMRNSTGTSGGAGSTSTNSSSSSSSDRDDVVERFCTKHADKIRNYVRDLSRHLPMPDLHLNDIVAPLDLLNKSFIHTNSLCKKLKGRKPTYTLKFFCAKRCTSFCLFDKNYFEITTVYPTVWIHIVFLAIQVSPEISYIAKKCYFLILFLILRPIQIEC